jgi:hypothetical protein
MPAYGFVGRHAQAADELIGLENENRLDDLAYLLPSDFVMADDNYLGRSTTTILAG